MADEIQVYDGDGVSPRQAREAKRRFKLYIDVSFPNGPRQRRYFTGYENDCPTFCGSEDQALVVDIGLAHEIAKATKQQRGRKAYATEVR